MPDDLSRRSFFKVLGIVSGAAAVAATPSGWRLALARVAQATTREVMLLTEAGVVLGRGELNAENEAYFEAGEATGLITVVVLPRMVKHMPRHPVPVLDPTKDHLSMRRNRAGGWTVTAAARILKVAPIQKCAGDTLRVAFTWLDVI